MIGGYEEATNKDTWRNPDQGAASYFARLVAWGYTLSEVEQIVLDGASRRAEEREKARAFATAQADEADGHDDETAPEQGHVE